MSLDRFLAGVFFAAAVLAVVLLIRAI